MDSRSILVDSGSPLVDSGSVRVDSGSVRVDSGSVRVDLGSPLIDSGSPRVHSRGQSTWHETSLGALRQTVSTRSNGASQARSLKGSTLANLEDLESARSDRERLVVVG